MTLVFREPKYFRPVEESAAPDHESLASVVFDNPYSLGRSFGAREQGDRSYFLLGSLGPHVPPERFHLMRQDFWDQAGRELFPPIHDKLVIYLAQPETYSSLQAPRLGNYVGPVIDAINESNVMALHCLSPERVRSLLDEYSGERLVLFVTVGDPEGDITSSEKHYRFLHHELKKYGIPTIADENSYTTWGHSTQLIKSLLDWETLRTIPLHCQDFSLDLIMRSLPREKDCVEIFQSNSAEVDRDT